MGAQKNIARPGVGCGAESPRGRSSLAEVRASTQPGVWMRPGCGGGGGLGPFQPHHRGSISGGEEGAGQSSGPAEDPSPVHGQSQTFPESSYGENLPTDDKRPKWRRP